MTFWKFTRNINLLMPEELLAMVDEAAKHRFMSRSEYIRFVLEADIRERRLKRSKSPEPIKPEWLDIDDS